MIAVTRRITLAATAAVALHAAPAAAEDKASFVFTPLVLPHYDGPVYVTGVYQDKAIGYYAPQALTRASYGLPGITHLSLLSGR